jgi:hypothetical protein
MDTVRSAAGAALGRTRSSGCKNLDLWAARFKSSLAPDRSKRVAAT